MKKKWVLILTIFVAGCSGPNKKVINNLASIDDASQEINKLIKQAETAAKNKADTTGFPLTTILFNVRTSNIADYPNGLIPYASIETPEKDIPFLIDKDEVVLYHNSIKIIIDYPLTTPYEFTLNSKSGFTRKQLLKEISRHYFILYDEEEKTASIKTLPLKKRALLNRNQTNGKYGVWGHDISDLMLDDVQVFRSTHGVIVLTLDIDS